MKTHRQKGSDRVNSHNYSCPIFLCAILLFLSIATLKAQIFREHWKGQIQVVGREIEFNAHFKKGDSSWSGTVDIPSQGAKALELANVKINGNEIRFEIPIPTGVARFVGTIEERGEMIEGSFSQSGTDGAFGMKPYNPSAEIPAEWKEDPTPYKTEQVKISSVGNTLAGTLALPNGKGPFPIVITFSGSGAQNRDENIGGWRPFKLLTDRLVEIGFAVLRCDDRGMGQSTGTYSTANTRDFSVDLGSQVMYVRSRPEIDPQKIVLLGHSEGCSVAAMTAHQDQTIAGLILLAPAGVSGEEVLISQSRAIGIVEGKTEAERERDSQILAIILKGAKGIIGWDEVRVALYAMIRSEILAAPEKDREGIKDIDYLAKQMTEQQMTQANSPWYRFFVVYDPAQDFKSVGCPTVAIFGERDVQIVKSVNQPAIEKAFSLNPNTNAKLTTAEISGMNHLLMFSESGKVSDYGKGKMELCPGLSDKIKSWLVKNVRGANVRKRVRSKAGR